MRTRQHDGREETWALILPDGPARPVPPTTRFAPLAPLEGTAVEGLTIELEVVAPLGDRGRAAIRAVDALGRALVLEALPPPGPRPTLGPLWRVDRHLIVAVDRPGGRRSLHAVDLSRTRARLTDREALTALAAHDLPRAIALWQRARQEDATYGDAPYNLACAYARAGNHDLAAAHLEAAIAIDAPRYRLLARLDPDLESLAEVPTSTRSVDPASASR